MRTNWIGLLILPLMLCLPMKSVHASDRLQGLIDSARESIHSNQLDRAKKQLKQAIRIKFDAAEPHYLLGKIAEQSGNPRKAAREYRSAKNFDPKNLLAASSWGRVAAKLDNTDAVAAYKQAINIDPTNPLWQLKLSEFYMSQKSKGMRMRARNHLKKALKLNPNHRQALQLLIALELDIGMPAWAKKYQRRLDQLVDRAPSPMQHGAMLKAEITRAPSIHIRAHALDRAAPSSVAARTTKKPQPVTPYPAPQSSSTKIRQAGMSHQNMALLDLRDDLTAKRGELRALERELGAAQDKASITDAEINIKKESLNRLEKNVSDRLNKLKRAEAFSRDEPDFNIGSYKQKWRDARQDFDKAKRDLDASDQELKQMQVVIRAKKQALERSKQQIISLNQQAAMERFAEMKRSIETEHVVNAHGESACENMTVKDCKQAALLNAEHNAIEQGSSVTIESLTEIKDFAVSRDEIRSSMRAIITGKEIVKKGWIGESAYFYDIRATVRGQVPPSLNPNRQNGMVRHRHISDNRFRLIIQTTPRYAEIVIENLGRQYTPGIHLPPGIYNVRISAEGYKTVQQQIEIIDSDMTLPIDMTRIANNKGYSSTRSVACKKASAMMDEARMLYSPMRKERLMHTATTICPQDPGFLYELGVMYVKRKQSGDWRKAKQAFEGVLRLDPNYPNVRSKLRKLNQQQKNGASNAAGAQILMGIGSLLLQ